MSRLLFAAARGARIEEYNASADAWFLTLVYDLTDEHRIHPDDEHLQYGSISTALRASAKDHESKPVLMYDTVRGTWGIAMTDWYAFRDCHSELHRSLFLLILAEALADEGL